MSEPVVWRVVRLPTALSSFGETAVYPWAGSADCPACGRLVKEPPIEGQRMVWETGSPLKLGSLVWNEHTEEAFVMPELAERLSVLPGVSFSDLPLEPRVQSRSSERFGRALPKRFFEELSGYRRLGFGPEVPMDLERSSIRVSPQRGVCDVCGMLMLQWREPDPDLPDGAVEPDLVLGVEHFRSVRDALTLAPVDYIREPRRPHHGVVFSREQLGDLALWSVTQDGLRTYLCDDRFRAIVVSHAATNVEFLECGTIID